jgi:uncharacterized C2H2 Zn-finger protein
MAIKCPSCQQQFDDTESYNNHTCNPATLVGGAGDVYSGEQKYAKKDDTGER